MEQGQEAKKNVNKPFCIGIIVTEFNAEDILYYNEQFKELNRLYKDQVKLLFFGYRPESDKNNMLRDIDYEYVKPVSTIHYFKQLKACEIDLLFIPLINNTYNTTSEDHDKYMESALYEIPVITVEMYPYDRIIGNDFNGFLYKDRESFIPYMKDLLFKKLADGSVKLCGKRALEYVLKDFNFMSKNIETVSDIYS
jgi:hypothetical protein